MSYQSLNDRPAAERPLAKGVLITACVLSVVALVALHVLTRRHALPPETPTRPPPQHVESATIAPASTDAPATAEIDPASISDATPLPRPAIEPFTPDTAREQPTTPIVIAPESLASPRAIEETLAALGINAVTDDKTIINGRLFTSGDFIDEGRRIRFIRRDDGRLIFEVNGIRYARKPRD